MSISDVNLLIDCLVDVRVIARARALVQLQVAALAEEIPQVDWVLSPSTEKETEAHGEAVSYVNRNWGWQSTRKLVSRGNGHYVVRCWIKPLQAEPKNSKNRAQWQRSGKEARRLTNRARRRAGLI